MAFCYGNPIRLIQIGGHLGGLVKCVTLAQVVILRFVGSSPTSGSVLAARSLLRVLCLPHSLPLPCSHSVSISLTVSKYYKIKKKKNLIQIGSQISKSSEMIRKEGHGGRWELGRDQVQVSKLASRGMVEEIMSYPRGGVNAIDPGKDLGQEGRQR